MNERKAAGRINMDRIKRILALLIIPLLMVGVLAVKPEKAAAQKATVTVQFDMGSNHEELAEEVRGYLSTYCGYPGTRSGSVLTLTVPESDTVDTVLHNLWNYVTAALLEYDDMDNGEKFLEVGLHPVEDYDSIDDVTEEYSEHLEMGTPISDQFNKVYALWEKKSADIEATVVVPDCGTQVTVKDGPQPPHNPQVWEFYWPAQVPQPEITFPGKQCKITEYLISDDKPNKMCYWVKDKQNEFILENMFAGKMIGGKSYYVGMYIQPRFGYVFDPEALPTAKMNGKKAEIIYHGTLTEPLSDDGDSGSYSDKPMQETIEELLVIGEVEVVHNWDDGKITKQPTATTPGEKTFTCKGCGEKRIEKIPALGGKSPMLKMTSKGAKAMNLKVSAVPGASGYEIFMSRCNGPEKRAPKKVKSFNKGKSFTWTKGGLKPNVVYKAYARAYKIEDGKKVYIAKSPLMHALTNAAGGRRTNPSGVTVKKAKVSLAAGKSAQIKAKVKSLIPGRALPAASHGKKLRYMSSDSSVATVSASGKITGKAAGKCKVYAYAINGACKAVNVTVK